MNAREKISLYGAGFVLCAGTLMAQEAGDRAPGQGRDGKASGAEARAVAGAMAGHETRMLIGHAVSMAIGGATLKGQAEQAGPSGAPGQADSRGGQDRGGAGQDPAQQLMMHARKGMQESRRLLQAAGKDRASAQPLYTAADGYINTLFALCGDSSPSRDAGASGPGDAASDAGRARTGRSARDEDLGAGRSSRPGKALDARDKAAVALINHSVCEVIEGTHMTHMLQSQAAGDSAAVEILRRHAREMTSEGRETLQRFLGSSRDATGRAGDAEPGNAARARDDRAGNERPKAGGDANADGNREAEVSVTTLARRGQELIEAYQAGGHHDAQGGADRTGGSRRDREGNPSDAARPSGAEGRTDPR